MTEISKERRDAIRAAAEKATPGPWEVGPVDDTVVTHLGADGLRYEIAGIDGDYNSPDEWPTMEANAAHIANCDPQTILALLDALDAAEAKLASAEPVAWTDPHSLLWEAERIAGDLLTYGSPTKRRDAETIRRMIDLLAAPPAAEPMKEPGPLGFADPDTIDEKAFLVRGKQAGQYSMPVYAAPPSAPAIPEGWVLVPKEPTEAMKDALWQIAGVQALATGLAAWGTMLAAVPALVSEKEAE